MPPRRIVFSLLGGVAGPVVALLLLFLCPGAVGLIENVTTDWRARLLGPVAPVSAPSVLIIALDDKTGEVIGKYPWPRSLHARMIRRLKALGAAAIVYDMYFSRPSDDPQQDQELAQAMAEAGNVVLGFLPQLRNECPSGAPDLSPESFSALQPFLLSLEAETKKIHPPEVKCSYPLFPDLAKVASGVGHISYTPDSDGVYRRVPVVIQVRDQLLPALGLAGLKPLNLYDWQKMSWEGRYLELPSRDPKRAHSLRLPLDANANLILNWTGGWSQKGALRKISAQSVLNPSSPEDETELKTLIADAICFVGRTDTASKDTGSQPFDPAYLRLGFHAELANTLLGGNFRTQAGTAAVIVYLLFLSFLSLAPGLIGRPWLAYVFGLLVLLGYAGYSLLALAFFQNFIPVFLPAVSFVLSFATVMVLRISFEHREMQLLRERFGNILPPGLLKQLEENPKAVPLQSERRELTILFSDIAGFTRISDREEPEVVYEMLTDYFGAMTEIIFKHGGTIDKFMGDGILAFWGAPLARENHALDAVRAGVEMQKEIRRLNKEWEQQGRPTIHVRIGINTGWVHVGFFGSNRRREYTVLGSPVNMAQRLESNCRPGNILISNRTRGLVRSEFPARDMGSIKLKGFPEPVEVFEIECGESEGQTG